MSAPTPRPSLHEISARTRARRRSEARFRRWGALSVMFSLAVLALMLVTIFSDGLSSFRQTVVSVPVTISDDVDAPLADWADTLAQSLHGHAADEDILPEGMGVAEVGAMLSRAAPAELRDRLRSDPSLAGQVVRLRILASGRIDGYLKGRETRESAARTGRLSVAQMDLADALIARGELRLGFNWRFFTAPDASDMRPEAAGLGVAIAGSIYMMLLVVALALPVGVAASIWLEEFAPKNRLTDLIEVNISNLAAVPSIVFGILGLAVFVGMMRLPLSSPLVGALVLSLMTLPTVIIATRAAIQAVPPSIRDAALGVGASRMQAVFHHVLPLAMPGILTGAILGLATALGETAPLLLIGMVAFIQSAPAAPMAGFLDPATALPVQVYAWVQRSDPAFVERASGAIIVLLAFLLVMNLGAILLRRRFERRW